ncbi:hypothetical protein ILUMI_08718, partial [Ignelater luminosus]
KREKKQARETQGRVQEPITMLLNNLEEVNDDVYADEVKCEARTGKAVKPSEIETITTNISLSSLMMLRKTVGISIRPDWVNQFSQVKTAQQALAVKSIGSCVALIVSPRKFIQNFEDFKPIDVIPTARQRPRSTSKTQKSYSNAFRYLVSSNDEKVYICKEAFINIHGITIGRVRRLNQLVTTDSTPKDVQGLNTPGNKKHAHTIKFIKNHIQSFPVKMGRYKEYCYLSEKLDVKRMHALCLEENLEVLKDIKYAFYLKIFKEHVNLCFGRPQVDTSCT